jgi:hypothetical protein
MGVSRLRCLDRTEYGDLNHATGDAVMREAIVTAFVAAALFTGEAAAQCPTSPGVVATVIHPAYSGDVQNPRVLIDQGHFNMQTPSGSYRTFTELICNDGYHVSINTTPFDSAVLAEHDVLVIVSPQPYPDSLVRWSDPVITHASWTAPALAEEEIDTIVDWVRHGGALLLITGHAPQAFWSAPLAGRFGVDVHNSYAADSVNSDRASETIPRGAWVLFSRENGLLADHPVTNGRSERERVRRIRGNGAASLAGPPSSAAFLKLGDFAHEWIFHAFAFWDDARYSVAGAAGRAQGVALRHGDGRVVVLAPSAIFFETYMARTDMDYRRLALNVMHWLSGLTEPSTAPGRGGRQ